MLANLTDLELSNISLFEFGNETTVEKRSAVGCKTFPGDYFWPSPAVWKIFGFLTGGALIETVPIGAVCYPKNKYYNAAKCQNILDHWTESATQ